MRRGCRRRGASIEGTKRVEMGASRIETGATRTEAGAARYEVGPRCIEVVGGPGGGGVLRRSCQGEAMAWFRLVVKELFGV